MARRITAIHADALVSDTESPKARITAIHAESLVKDAASPNARITAIHVEMLVRVMPPINPAIINNPFVI